MLEKIKPSPYKEIGYFILDKDISIMYKDDPAFIPSFATNNKHNIELLNRRIESNVQYEFEKAKKLRKVSNNYIKISMAILLFNTIIQQDISFLMLLYTLLASVSALCLFKISKKIYDQAYIEKQVLENLEEINASLTEKDLQQLTASEKVFYDNHGKINHGNLDCLSHFTNKVLVKKVKEGNYCGK